MIANLSPRFMKSIFFALNSHYDLRSEVTFKTENIRTVRYGSETISFRGPIIWRKVPTEIKTSNSLSEFKRK